MRSLTKLRRLSAGGICLILLTAIFGDKGLVRLTHIYKLEKNLEGSINDLKRHNQELALEIAELKDPNRLEGVIRQELNLVRPNEVVIFFSE